MDNRDVELKLSTQLASFEATFAAFARETSRRWDEANRKLEDIDQHVRLTNGRVTTLEGVNARRDQVEIALLRPRPMTLNDIKLYVAIAIGSGTMAVGVVLWVLKVADIL